MNKRNLFLIALVIAALALGAGLILAQDDGGGHGDDPPARARHHFGFGGRGMAGQGRVLGQVGAELLPLITEATGMEADALRSALADGSSLAGLIEANGGDVAAFSAQATELLSARANASIAARIEALVNGEYRGMHLRGFGGRGMAGRGMGLGLIGPDALALITEATGLEADALRSAMREGSSLAGLIEANGGDVAAFSAQAGDMAHSMIDAAVADGRLSEERADTLKAGSAARIEALVNGEYRAAIRGMHLRGFGGRGMAGRGMGLGLIGADALALVTEATGLEADALRSAMREGSSLAGLIEANGGDVAAFSAQAGDMAHSMIDAAVADGRLSEARADTLKAGSAARIEALVNGEYRAAMRGMDLRGAHRDRDHDKSMDEDSMDDGDSGETADA